MIFVPRDELVGCRKVFVVGPGECVCTYESSHRRPQPTWFLVRIRSQTIRNRSGASFSHRKKALLLLGGRIEMRREDARNRRSLPISNGRMAMERKGVEKNQVQKRFSRRRIRFHLVRQETLVCIWDKNEASRGSGGVRTRVPLQSNGTDTRTFLKHDVAQVHELSSSSTEDSFDIVITLRPFFVEDRSFRHPFLFDRSNTRDPSVQLCVFGASETILRLHFASSYVHSDRNIRCCLENPSRHQDREEGCPSWDKIRRIDGSNDWTRKSPPREALVTLCCMVRSSWT